jgi:hypothetical protein
MSITITITGDAAQVRAHMAQLLGMAHRGEDLFADNHQADAMLYVEPTETPVDMRHMMITEESVRPPEEKVNKRGRPRKDAGSAEAPAPSPEPASSTAPPAGEPSSPAEYVMTAAEAEAHRAPNAVPAEASLEDVRDALRALAGAKGTDPCSALLKKFGASKSSELKPEDRAAFVAEAKALVDA